MTANDSTRSYDFVPSDGVPIKAWTRGVPFEDGAKQQLRNLAQLGYWSQDETWPLVGYAGPLLRRPESPA